jgi:hypothetical protein
MTTTTTEVPGTLGASGLMATTIGERASRRADGRAGERASGRAGEDIRMPEASRS